MTLEQLLQIDQAARVSIVCVAFGVIVYALHRASKEPYGHN